MSLIVFLFHCLKSSEIIFEVWSVSVKKKKSKLKILKNFVYEDSSFDSSQELKTTRMWRLRPIQNIQDCLNQNYVNISIFCFDELEQFIGRIKIIYLYKMVL